MSWTTSSLADLLSKQNEWVVSQDDGCLCVTNEDGVDCYVAVSGSEIMAETFLFAENQVSSIPELNQSILETHKMFPLTTIGVSAIGDDRYYVCFGALSSQSKEESIVIELETLFTNVAGFLDAYESFLK